MWRRCGRNEARRMERSFTCILPFHSTNLFLHPPSPRKAQSRKTLQGTAVFRRQRRSRLYGERCVAHGPRERSVVAACTEVGGKSGRRGERYAADSTTNVIEV